MKGPGTQAIRKPLWAALQNREAPACTAELARAIGATSRPVQLRLRSWAKAGLLTVTLNPAVHPNYRKEYAMTEASRATAAPPAVDHRGQPRLERAGRDRMWRAIRTLKRFDLPTLLMTAEVTRRSAEDFINALLRAGLLIREQRGSNHRFTWSIYALARPAGPLTPVVRHRATAEGRVREVFDPNTDQLHDISPRRASAPFFDPVS